MKDKIKFSDFQKLDIRVGTVVDAEIPSWSHWVMKLTVDFSSKGRSASGRGEDLGKKVAFAGIMKFFKPEDLINRQFPFIANLEPKKIGPLGDVSECMMIMAVPSHEATAGKAVPEASGPEEPLARRDDEETPPVLFKLEKKVDNGTKVF